MYVVAGVTGNTGKVVANALLARGKDVRVIVRDAAKGAPFAAKGAQVAVADLGDDKALARAFEGAAGAYVLLPPNYGAADFRAYQDATSHSIASALRAARVPHAVLLSSIGAEQPRGTGPIAGLHVTERLLRDVPGLASTFIRAGYFMENLGGALASLDQGILPTFVPAKLPIDMIAARDIGELAATLLVEGPASAGIINLGGPAITMEEAARAVSQVVGKEIRVVEAGLDAVVPTFTSFGASQSLAELYREMLGAFSRGAIQWQGQHRRVTGTTSVEEVLGGLLRAPRAA